MPHGAPKRVLVYPLRRDARQQLRAAEAHPAWTPWRHKVQLRDSELESLYEKLCRVQDPRGERGKRYALPTVLTIVGAARPAYGPEVLSERRRWYRSEFRSSRTARSKARAMAARRV